MCKAVSNVRTSSAEPFLTVHILFPSPISSKKRQKRLCSQGAQSCPQRNDPGGKLVLLGVVIVGSLALTKMSRRLEVRL